MKYAGYFRVCLRCDPNRAYPLWDEQYGATDRPCPSCGGVMAVRHSWATTDEGSEG